MMRALLVTVLAACSARPAARVTPPAPAQTTSSRGCLADSQCAAGERCFGPDFEPHGVSRCESDDACRGIGEVCEQGRCELPCAGASCGSGSTCSADGHCHLLACTAPGATPCQPLFACNRASGACERTSCRTDADCGAAPNACWQGHCFDHGGACKPAASCCPP